MNKRIFSLIITCAVSVLLIASCAETKEPHGENHIQSTEDVRQSETETTFETPETAAKSDSAESDGADTIYETEKNGSEGENPKADGIEEKDGVTYIRGILVVNKTYSLPKDYNPGTDKTAEAALYEMFDAAKQDGITLWIASGFRSYDTQEWLYGNYVTQEGKEAADTFSARAGHSEHQTGLAFDLNYVEDWFGDSPAGIWIAENSWKYGFTVRYPKDKEDKTGYKYEAWHVRYFGKEIAKELHESGLCLEEYLGITSEYNY